MTTTDAPAPKILKPKAAPKAVNPAVLAVRQEANLLARLLRACDGVTPQVALQTAQRLVQATHQRLIESLKPQDPQLPPSL